ncbi:class I SAM-dependent methyltransferase, partial [Streptomyces sp. NPDC057674]
MAPPHTPSPAPSASPGVHHPLFARFYARFSVSADAKGGLGALRAELLAGLSGRVIEIGAGNGLNFAHYPAGVTEVVALEPESRLRRLAQEAALRSPVPVTVLPDTAEALPLEDASFDAAVASLVLCTVRNLPQALAELHRVLRPGAELRFFEHGLADSPGLAR